MKCNGGNLTYSYSLVSESYTGKLLTYQSYRVDATCKTPQSTKEWRLNRVVTDQCGTLQASCTQLGSSTDAASCQTIKGIRVCEPWWNKTVEYSCRRAYECSTFPEDQAECGTWFSGSMPGCISTAQTGIWDIAVKRFKQIQGNLTCQTFSLEDQGAPAIPGGPFYNGCGTFQVNDTANFGRDSRKYRAHCAPPVAALPPNLLREQTSEQAEANGITLKYRTFDYFGESEKDSCKGLLDSMSKQGVKCSLLEEDVDGIATFTNGNKLASAVPQTCRTMAGMLGNYEFCRAWWTKTRTYYCPADKIAAKAEFGKHNLTDPKKPNPGATDDAGFGKGMGSLAVATEISKSIGGDSGCANPKPDGSCDTANIRLFPGTKESCKKDSLDLSLINYTCCKANLKAECGSGSSKLCLDFCQDEDILTSINVYDKKVDVQVGDHCTDLRCSTTPLGGVPAPTVNGQCLGFWVCHQKRTYYCQFNSILGRLIQVQGRAQLSRGFGSGEFPNCEGLTMDEFMQLDLTKIDFKEFIDSLDLTPVATGAIDTKDITKTIQESVNGLSK